MTWHMNIGKGMLIVSWAKLIGLGFTFSFDYGCAALTFGGLTVVYYWRLPPDGNAGTLQ